MASITVTLPTPKDIYQVYYRGAWGTGKAQVRHNKALSSVFHASTVPHALPAPTKESKQQVQLCPGPCGLRTLSVLAAMTNPPAWVCLC